jgi:hypothetical protein
MEHKELESWGKGGNGSGYRRGSRGVCTVLRVFRFSFSSFHVSFLASEQNMLYDYLFSNSNVIYRVQSLAFFSSLSYA